MYKISLIVILVIGISLTPLSFSEGIPEWVKNNASWWSERQISQSEFVNGLEFLINEGVIYIPPTEPGIPGPEKIIPDWVRNTAGWWSENLIPDSEFINAMKYLIEIGIIEVDASSPEFIEEQIIEEESQIEVSSLNVVLDGNEIVHNNKNFLLDVKVFDSENYSGNDFSIHRKGIDGVNVTIQLFNQEGELIHTFDSITKYNGLVQYEVLAKETSQTTKTGGGGLWLINNVYTVKVTANLGEQYGENQWEFSGVWSEYDYTQGSRNRAPLNLAATAGNDQVSLSWTAPAMKDITDYKIEYCKIEPPTHNFCPSYDSDGNDSGNHWTEFVHDPTDLVGCNNVTIQRTEAEGGNYTFVKCDADVSDVVTGLEDSTQYLFRVAAINYAGTGAFTATVTATTT